MGSRLILVFCSCPCEIYSLWVILSWLVREGALLDDDDDDLGNVVSWMALLPLVLSLVSLVRCCWCTVAGALMTLSSQLLCLLGKQGSYHYYILTAITIATALIAYRNLGNVNSFLLLEP